MQASSRLSQCRWGLRLTTTASRASVDIRRYDLLGGLLHDTEQRDPSFCTRREVFVIVEPAAHRRMHVGLHNPGLPTDARFCEAVEFGPRRITHRLTLHEDAQIDDDLHARLHTAYMLALEGEPR